MSDSQWYQGIGEAFQGLARGYYFLKEVFNNFLSVLFDYPILTLILGISVFITVCYFAVNFFIDFVNDFDSATETISINSVRQKRYMERQIEREQKAEQRYQERKKQNQLEYDRRREERRKEKYPNLDNEMYPEYLAEDYFNRYPYKLTFSYGGQTFYNNDMLNHIYRKNRKSSEFGDYDEMYEKDIKTTMDMFGFSREEAISLMMYASEKGIYDVGIFKYNPDSKPKTKKHKIKPDVKADDE